MLFCRFVPRMPNWSAIIMLSHPNFKTVTYKVKVLDEGFDTMNAKPGILHPIAQDIYESWIYYKSKDVADEKEEDNLVTPSPLDELNPMKNPPPSSTLNEVGNPDVQSAQDLAEFANTIDIDLNDEQRHDEDYRCDAYVRGGGPGDYSSDEQEKAEEEKADE